MPNIELAVQLITAIAYLLSALRLACYTRGDARYRREVAGHHDRVGPLLVGPQPGKDTVVGVVVIQPAETGLLIIGLIQGSFMTVEVVEITDQALLTAVLGIL